MTVSVVDASVWVSSLLAHDVHHKQTRRWMHAQATADGAFVVPILGLIEVSGVITRRTGDSGLAHEAIDGIRRIPGLRVVALDPQLGEEAVRLAADLALKGADTIYMAVAKHLEIPLVTWDREQHERGSDVIPTQTPQEALETP